MVSKLTISLLWSSLFLGYVAYANEGELPKNSNTIQGASEGMASSVIWALNVGGKAHLDADGTFYHADENNQQAHLIEIVEGAQDETVFKSYILGKNEITKELANGYYDITFKFAEPNKIGREERVFNILVEGKVVVSNLDTILRQDGNADSSSVITVTDVLVEDSALNIELESITGKPLLNALVVKRKKQLDEGWQLIWRDEFEYEGVPDPKKWNYVVWPAKQVNNEDQAYTNRLKNARVENGHLIIQAHREDYGSAKFTSGRITSAGKGDLLYGRIEVKAKLPAGQGTWPAIWMLPTDFYRYAAICPSEKLNESFICNGGGWPNSGEIDIMEHVGYDMNRVHATVHNLAYYWVNGEQRKASINARNVDQKFHVYAMEWSPKKIDIFYDNTLYFTYLNQGEGWQAWPYDHPFHLILNLAVGGNWGAAGGATDLDAFPASMFVDYVRFYQKPKTP